MEFFNNKDNDILKFKINSEGINVNDIEPRLILMTKENKNVLLIGEVDKDICRFTIPELGIYEKGDNGKIKFEIISEELYFPVWEDNFQIKTKASLKVEELISEVQQTSRPTISVSEAKIESKPVFEKKVIKEEVKEDKKVKVNETLSKLESIFDKKPIIIEEEEDNEEVVEQVKENKSESIIKFDSFK